MNTIKLNILSRVYTDKQIDELIKVYLKAKKARGGSKRIDNLTKKVTVDEKAALHSYLNDTDVPVDELAKEHKYKSASSFMSSVKNTAFRLVFDHQEIFDE